MYFHVIQNSHLKKRGTIHQLKTYMYKKVCAFILKSKHECLMDFRDRGECLKIKLQLFVFKPFIKFVYYKEVNFFCFSVKFYRLTLFQTDKLSRDKQLNGLFADSQNTFFTMTFHLCQFEYSTWHSQIFSASRLPSQFLFAI